MKESPEEPAANQSHAEVKLVTAKRAKLKLMEQSHCARCWRPLRVSTEWPGPRLDFLPPVPTDRALLVLQCGHVYHSCCTRDLSHCSACHVFVEKFRPLLVTDEADAEGKRRRHRRRRRDGEKEADEQSAENTGARNEEGSPMRTAKAPGGDDEEGRRGEAASSPPLPPRARHQVERASPPPPPQKEGDSFERRRGKKASSSEPKRRIAELQERLDDIAKETLQIRRQYTTKR